MMRDWRRHSQECRSECLAHRQPEHDHRVRGLSSGAAARCFFADKHGEDGERPGGERCCCKLSQGGHRSCSVRSQGFRTLHILHIIVSVSVYDRLMQNGEEPTPCLLSVPPGRAAYSTHQTTALLGATAGRSGERLLHRITTMFMIQTSI